MISRAALILVMVASAWAQSSKPKASTNNQPAKDKHSKDEIAEWIISHATFDYQVFSTSVSKSPDACTLHIKTHYHARFPPPDDPSPRDARIKEWLTQEDEYQVPLATVDAEEIALVTEVDGLPQVLGSPNSPDFHCNPCASLYLTTINKKDTLTASEFREVLTIDGGHAHSQPQRWGPLSYSSAEFSVTDVEMGKRMMNAFKDLVVQCGGKPPKPAEPEKKEIY
jgi:hypothetical protein